ncbi:MAG: helix-turn-helix domain-containing protein [Paracoccus sp. (in: a-proteobacteria)]|uniref:winged helix-turn-helix transcriptional regulator n=1 Tax=Paracoccus sp. TaxID=267 RepID=UPI0026E075EF|nr:helix-turn-helix domain-containing protein [Paracoccus sp. (in: a-proteobacteria)]MDO5631310.1 helix-turn-helix domain-containing protein [Paracoccus sp. (in: a-proteobacteria)]
MERPAWNAFNTTCPTRQVLSCIADKWAVLIVGALRESPRRTGQLRRMIEGISQKMLTQTLRNLERDGLVSRRDLGINPPAVEYALTPLGQSLAQIVDDLRHWAEGNIEQILDARQRFNQPSV